MNRQLTVLALALVAALAIAVQANERDVDGEEYSSLSLIPDDDNEVANLPAENEIFTDFCIDSRDELKKFLIESAHSQSAAIFDVIFGSVGEVGEELISAQREAVEESAEIIKNNVVPETRDVLPSKEVAQENLEKSVENLTLLQALKEAVKVVINAVIETAQTQLFERLAQLRACLNAETFKEKLTDACHSITGDLQRRLETKLTATKKKIISSASAPKPSGNSKTQASDSSKTLASGNLVAVVSKIRLDTVGCTTTNRVLKVAKLCDAVKLAGPTIFPLLGL